MALVSVNVNVNSAVLCARLYILDEWCDPACQVSDSGAATDEHACR